MGAGEKIGKFKKKKKTKQDHKFGKTYMGQKKKKRKKDTQENIESVLKQLQSNPVYNKIMCFQFWIHSSQRPQDLLC